MKPRYLIGAILLFIAALIFWVLYNREPVTPYAPSEKFAEAYARFGDEKSDKGEAEVAAEEQPTREPYYDIEQTVRIMNSLEIAQSKAKSFDELLLYMAKQDYTGVAPEVLACKQQIFPILEELHALEEEAEEITSAMSYLNSISSTIGSNSTETALLATLLALDPTMLVSTIDSAFEAYQEQVELERKTREKIKEINRKYIAYIEEYSPVYHKYMREWNELCLIKDKTYIDLYSARYTDALNDSQKILERHPNNPEGLLLTALSHIQVADSYQEPTLQQIDITEAQNLPGEQQATLPTQPEKANATLANPHYLRAEQLLDSYLELYPDRAAPALLLKGVAYGKMGRSEKAYGLLDQAAIEYPRQAEALTDILNAYNNRTYLEMTAEGNYLLNYYRSTMGGYGIFSPNLQKAALLADEGRMEESREEIYKHFFRRSNQATHHCLLTDMQYCEQHLAASFKPIFMEASYMDISHASSDRFLGMGAKKNKIDVNYTNRSDVRLENVRLFLCIHYTDMYSDDYEVLKIPQTKNIIEPFQTITFKDVSIEPHKVSEITRIRGIVITDDRVGWVDSPEMKIRRIVDDAQRRAELKPNQALQRTQYMADLGVDAPWVKQLIAENTLVNGKPLITNRTKAAPTTYVAPRVTSQEENEGVLAGAASAVGEFFTGSEDPNKQLYFRMPRVLSMFAPTFTLYSAGESEKTCYPTKHLLEGEYIQLLFDKELTDGEEIPLYLYGNCITLRIRIKRAGERHRLIGIEEL